MPKYQPYNRRSITRSPYWSKLDPELREAVDLISQVLPFRTNDYVLSELIDWDAVPDDPIYRLVFPHATMLAGGEYQNLRSASASGDAGRLATTIASLRRSMNPHPAGQLTHNVPTLDDHPVEGVQHKYRETVLFFPRAGQTCHAYCTFCFRWPQFVGDDELRFASADAQGLVEYLRSQPDVTDVLITGGDPLIAKTSTLARYLEPLLSGDGLDHIRNIRIGTKSLGYWPHRFVSDPDADDLLRLFERIRASGRQLAVMGHYSHPRELQTDVARKAIRRLGDVGAVLRMQAPLLRHINDDPSIWRDLWAEGVALGAVPYYMFVERDTGPRNYFEVPLARAHEIFQEAYQSVSGLCRSVRGPSMSAFPGKILIDGTPTIAGERVFALQLIQARDAALVRQPFYAKFDPAATWITDLEPAFSDAFPFDLGVTHNSRRHLDLVGS